MVLDSSLNFSSVRAPSSNSPIIVAMDFADPKLCIDLARQLQPHRCRLKVGKELFTASGPQLVETLINLGFDVFLDLKFHDIPNTVAKALKVAASLGVWMVNVHASGGERMLLAAKEAIVNADTQPLLIAVTVLTSIMKEDLRGMHIPQSPEERVLSLARLTQRAGLDGVVCSAKEAAMLKQHCGQDFCLVTPGIRPDNFAIDDQRRVVTPQQALANGSDYIVIGRPITQSTEPALTCETIYNALNL